MSTNERGSPECGLRIIMPRPSIASRKTLDSVVVETEAQPVLKATWDTSSDLRKDIIASRCAHVEGRPPFVEQTASVPISEPTSARFGQVMLAF
ncbi:hypothetical protein CPLU01_00932 [Colletotrichum plurivorum]|uniref:Uncharacterized protein n=1 Tax=Colletotrichum plurivorum TaxID=2175906 RepID=A0A8H6U5J0_9PEZI|nr:hypothetical protein CPLU01_00932 [Colletotrichum plurivorum]